MRKNTCAGGALLFGERERENSGKSMRIIHQYFSSANILKQMQISCISYNLKFKNYLVLGIVLVSSDKGGVLTALPLQPVFRDQCPATLNTSIDEWNRLCTNKKLFAFSL